MIQYQFRTGTTFLVIRPVETFGGLNLEKAHGDRYMKILGNENREKLHTWTRRCSKTSVGQSTFNAQFRAEFFNVLNHANFRAPLSNLTIFGPNGAPTANAGLINSTTTTSRQI
jgi:hypothetical protein